MIKHKVKPKLVRWVRLSTYILTLVYIVGIIATTLGFIWWGNKNYNKGYTDCYLEIFKAYMNAYPDNESDEPNMDDYKCTPNVYGKEDKCPTF